MVQCCFDNTTNWHLTIRGMKRKLYLHVILDSYTVASLLSEVQGLIVCGQCLLVLLAFTAATSIADK